MFVMALYFLLHFNVIQYFNNLLCISMDLNAFFRSTAAHIALFLAFDHINDSVTYRSRLLLHSPALGKSSLIFFYDLVLF